MGLFSKDIRSMDDLFVHQLQDIYYAEKRIVGALPDMIAKATSPELKSAFEAHLGQTFEAHLGQTKNHVKRVEQVFQMHGTQPKQVDCPAIDGIIEEADEVGGEIEDKNVLDAALIASAQAVEHYEMTSLRDIDRLGENLGPRGLRSSSATESRRRKSCGREADHAGGKRSQSRGRLRDSDKAGSNRRASRFLSMAGSNIWSNALSD
jgi:ferritin-like metal-binding protein YciE